MSPRFMRIALLILVPVLLFLLASRFNEPGAVASGLPWGAFAGGMLALFLKRGRRIL